MLRVELVNWAITYAFPKAR